MTSGHHTTFFLGRQPILNRRQEIIGHELLFRSTDKNYAEITNVSQAAAGVIASVLATFGIQDVLGGKLGFLNVNRDLIMSEMLEVLPVGQSVLEILETVHIDQELVERCHELKAMGFMLALDDHIYTPACHDLYEIVDIIKVDVLETDPVILPDMVRTLLRWPVRLLAEKVETQEQFDACAAMGFHLFQGYFFQRPVVLNKRSVDISGLTMLKLLKQLTTDAPLEEIEQTFKENPSLSYSLLRLVNSVAYGLRQKIHSLRHAIIMLGINQLRRWIQLSLFAGNDARGIDNPLLEMAAIRGRFMETLITELQSGESSEERAEEAFMTGLLSLLDVLFETPMPEIVAGLNLSEEISDALLTRSGEFGQLLTIAEKLELTDFTGLDTLLSQNNITLETLTTAQIDAINWRSGMIMR